MNKHTNIKVTCRRTIVTLIAASATTLVVIGGAAAGAQNSPPPWTLCAFADHPAAADLVPLIPVNVVPTAEVQAVLLGETPVGTDCSFYDLPV